MRKTRDLGPEMRLKEGRRGRLRDEDRRQSTIHCPAVSGDSDYLLVPSFFGYTCAKTEAMMNLAWEEIPTLEDDSSRCFSTVRGSGRQYASSWCGAVGGIPNLGPRRSCSASATHANLSFQDANATLSCDSPSHHAPVVTGTAAHSRDPAYQCLVPARI